MPTRNVKMGGLRRIYTKEYKVNESTIKQGSYVCPSGTLTINSQRIGDFIGENVRVVVYAKKRNKPRQYNLI